MSYPKKIFGDHIPTGPVMSSSALSTSNFDEMLPGLPVQLITTIFGVVNG